MAKFPTYEEMAQEVAQRALDEYEYEGKTLREWIEIIMAQHGTNLAEVGTDCISRQAAIDALDEYFGRIAKLKRRGLNKGEKAISLDVVGAIKTLPPIRPDKDKVSNLLYHIYSIQSPHLDMSGVIAKRYYCEELWKELFGKESELPGWMT